jgi:hypothetical protein
VRILTSPPALQLTQASERHPPEVSEDEQTYRALERLVKASDIAGARKEATLFLERHPASPWAARITALTGVHAHTSRDFPTPGR